jgi:hypothetical protein
MCMDLFLVINKPNVCFLFDLYLKMMYKDKSNQ